MNIDEYLRSLGLEPDDFGAQGLNDLFRKGSHLAGVRDAFKTDRYNQQRDKLIDDPYSHETPYSSNVEAVRYDQREDKLYIAFNNRRTKGKDIGTRLYVYFDIAQHGFDVMDIYDELATSQSPGSVVWERIRRAGVPFYRA